MSNDLYLKDILKRFPDAKPGDIIIDRSYLIDKDKKEDFNHYLTFFKGSIPSGYTGFYTERGASDTLIKRDYFDSFRGKMEVTTLVLTYLRSNILLNEAFQNINLFYDQLHIFKIENNFEIKYYYFNSDKVIKRKKKSQIN